MREELLQTILSQPTAPFRENHVIQAIEEILNQHSVPFFKDPTGNRVIGVSSLDEYLRLLQKPTPSQKNDPVLLFIAHMDHPGFIGTRWDRSLSENTKLRIQWHGGAPVEHLVSSSLWLATREGWAGNARIVEAQLTTTGRSIDTALIEVEGETARKAKATDLYGGFKFRAPWWREDRLLYTKAADDLVGCFAIVSLALDLFGKAKKGAKRGSKARPPFIGLLTRAEEVGFIGAIGHFQKPWLSSAKRPVICVSLETSRALPGAEIGKGPVVRLGDKYTVFEAGALRVFSEVAQSILPGAHQRRIMDGGTCEATAASVFGHRTIGISVPLGNYHNQSFEGGPDSRGPNGPAPEFVHLGDVQKMIELCHGLLKPKLPWSDPWRKRAQEFKKDFARYRTLLDSGP